MERNSIDQHQVLVLVPAGISSRCAHWAQTANRGLRLTFVQLVLGCLGNNPGGKILTNDTKLTLASLLNPLLIHGV